MKFEKMLQPGQIGKLRIRNRIIKSRGGAEDFGGINNASVEISFYGKSDKDAGSPV